MHALHIPIPIYLMYLLHTSPITSWYFYAKYIMNSHRNYVTTCVRIPRLSPRASRSNYLVSNDLMFLLPRSCSRITSLSQYNLARVITSLPARASAPPLNYHSHHTSSLSEEPTPAANTPRLFPQRTHQSSPQTTAVRRRGAPHPNTKRNKLKMCN
jgi:hypothetical protein